eukprot:7375280-Prorocentrum_lima.AAC.1
MGFHAENQAHAMVAEHVAYTLHYCRNWFSTKWDGLDARGQPGQTFQAYVDHVRQTATYGG